MGTALAISGGLSVIQGGIQAVQGYQQNKRANEALAKLVPPTLSNPYQNLNLATRGADYASENMARQNATMIDGAMRGGVRAFVGSAPAIMDATIQQNQAIMQNLDQQEMQNQQLQAQGDQWLQGMKENRYQNSMAGLQAERSQAQQNMWQGVNNAVGGIGNSAVASKVLTGNVNPFAKGVTTNTQTSTTEPAIYPAFANFPFIKK